MRTSFIVAAVLGVACVLAFGLNVQAQLLSPGPLSHAHRALEGDTKCTECHQAGQRVVAALCTKCHKEIAQQLTKSQGLHGTIWRKQTCGDCHLEHIGRAVSSIRWPGGDIKRFDHAPTGFVLKDAHARAACADCHTKRTSSGATTLLGLDKRCTSCHEDPHEKRLGSDCAKCHNEKTFEVARFDHDLTRFSLRGKHVATECKSCHGEPHRFEALRFDDCSSCHKSPHKNPKLGACKSCHVEEGFLLHQLSGKGVAQLRNAHPGVPLIGGHAAVACASCHGSKLDQPPERGSRCVDCHAPVHEARFGNRCERCHTQVRWLGLPDSLGYRVHDQTAFPLEGQHARVACSDCHAEERPRAERYRDVAHALCADCHKDPHAGELRDHANGECGACHVTQSFSPSTFGIAQHVTTDFHLDGKHAAAPCGTCHGEKHPRVELHPESSQCASCHANPHGDRVAEQLRDGGCAHCHATSGWEYPRIDHASWPLEGAHRDLSCDRCHERAAPRTQAQARVVDFARFGGAPRACEGCHDDPHAGQFSSTQPARECDDCHTSASFQISPFAHDTLTRFPLAGAHARAECADCHRPESLRNDRTAVRYRLGYASCSDCHADPHGSAR